MGEHYRAWRRQLSEIQEKFDNYENDLAHHESEEAYEEYKKNRKPFEDELEAHQNKLPDVLDADGL